MQAPTSNIVGVVLGGKRGSRKATQGLINRAVIANLSRGVSEGLERELLGDMGRYQVSQPRTSVTSATDVWDPPFSMTNINGLDT